eukprot:CAMPEP_0173435968 /NCGR_PEP_ID=MMETSP1357-20121228/15688_1 /TAXON_ID=77926 /ORGANISM="Hemiselmis rufescens, Strain PCC563" /LENGTH=395 /DNA_ID=CAMNT_0014401009 /DNA_START=52 /DNA_END=1235 /DNA_ORIENTATION=+
MPGTDWSKMKVSDLKKELENRGLDSKGLKADLVSRLEEVEGGGGGDGGDAPAAAPAAEGGEEEAQAEEEETAAPAAGEEPPAAAPEAAAQAAEDGGEDANQGKRAREEEGGEEDAAKRTKTEEAAPAEGAAAAAPQDATAQGYAAPAQGEAPPSYDAAQQQQQWGAQQYPGYGAEAAQHAQAQGQVPSYGGDASGATGYETTTVVIEVPNDKVGLVIGRGGCTIKELETMTGARVQVTPDSLWQGRVQNRPIQLSGYQTQVEYCKTLIAQKVGVEVSALASQQEFTAATATGGANNTGTPGQGGGAARAFVTSAPSGDVIVNVPNESVGLVIGKAGATIKYLEQSSGARIQIAKECPPGSNLRPITLTGPNQQCIQAAQSMILAKVNDGAAIGTP